VVDGEADGAHSRNATMLWWESEWPPRAGERSGTLLDQRHRAGHQERGQLRVAGARPPSPCGSTLSVYLGRRFNGALRLTREPWGMPYLLLHQESS